MIGGQRGTIYQPDGLGRPCLACLLFITDMPIQNAFYAVAQSPEPT